MRSEHPLGKAIFAHAGKQGRAIVEPQNFAYTHGQGIAAKVVGSMIIVGNRLWMLENSVGIPDAFSHGGEAASEIYVARNGCWAMAVRPGTFSLQKYILLHVIFWCCSSMFDVIGYQRRLSGRTHSLERSGSLD